MSTCTSIVPDAAALLMATLFLVLSTGAQGAQTNAVCGDSCKCSGRLLKRLAHYKGKLETAILKQQTMRTALMRLLVEAEQDDDKQTAKIAPAIQALGSTLEACDTAIADFREKYEPAIAAVSRARGRLAIAHRLAQATTDLKAKVLASNYWKTASIETHSIGTYQFSACTTAEEDEGAIAISDETEQSEKPTTKHVTHRLLKGKCVTAAVEDSCHETAMTAGEGYLEFKLAYGADGAADADPWAASTNTEKKLKAAAVDIYDKDLEEADANLTELRTKTDLKPCSADIKSLSALQAGTKFNRLAIKALLLEPDNERDATTPAKRLEQALKEAYGTGGANFAKVVYDTPGNKETEISDAENKKTAQLKNIGTLSELTDAFARLTLKRLAAAHDATANPAALAATAKDCSGKKGTECTGECEWDKEKETCTPKKKGEAENKEKDGKAASPCAGKDNKTCSTTQGCKWEDNKCKDSSILVNKQFALSVVSAAFAALLF
uniref:Variant surface glycoprotein 510 n=1 Tax=Trypanosoma brucei TaxID=5691 RepID=M4SY89_9TRYP|nr:variant surface glycoprotein 510 [Trypanosoma brucei]